jgi:AbrB family looped-hinge helix DNA binding protein
MAAVKLGVSRQVVIPKKLFDELKLRPGDYLEVELRGERLVLTPKVLVDKALERRLAEGLEDLERGRTLGPFESAKGAMRALRERAKARRK